jgi:hypothetical protein
MYVAIMNTSCFTFTAFGLTEDGARRNMEKAWKMHCKEYHVGNKWGDLNDEWGVNVVKVDPRVYYRDFMSMVGPRTTAEGVTPEMPEDPPKACCDTCGGKINTTCIHCMEEETVAGGLKAWERLYV